MTGAKGLVLEWQPCKRERGATRPIFVGGVGGSGRKTHFDVHVLWGVLMNNSVFLSAPQGLCFGRAQSNAEQIKIVVTLKLEVSTVFLITPNTQTYTHIPPGRNTPQLVQSFSELRVLSAKDKGC